MVCNFLYRDYGDFFIAYSPSSRIFLLIEDIYADFFRLEYIEKKSIDEVKKIIVDDYSVSNEIVHNDLMQFHNEINESVYTNDYIYNNELIEENRVTMQQQLFNKMSELMIPFSATIEIVDSCNLSCLHCYRGGVNPSYWTEKTFFSALEELKSLGTMNITITGGEPFTHPLIEKFLKITEKLGFIVSIQSNLLLLNDSLISALRKNVISNIYVSLYSTKECEHDAITQSPGSMKKTVENIKLLLENNVPVSLNCPIMKINKNAMEGMRNFANKLGVDVKFALKIIPSQDKSKKVESLNVFDKDFILSAMRNPEIQLYKNELNNIRSSKPQKRYCQTGFRSITFDAQGNMLICNAYRKNCGSLNDMNIESLWNDSTPLNNWRKEKSIVREKCNKCPAYSYCEPCPAHSFTQSGDEYNIDELTCLFGSNFYAADIEYLGKGGENHEEKV